MLESYQPQLFQHPMVHEANVWDASLGVILSDSVLGRHLRYMRHFSPKESEIFKYINWLYEVFPELLSAGDIPNPWTQGDLQTEAINVGTIENAGRKCTEWIGKEIKVAYWTGGLEFTRSQYEVANYLLGKKFRVIMGMEPFCYPNEFVKGRGSLSGEAVHLSFWSKYLGDKGCIFNVPRPLSTAENKRNVFYGDLYQQITQGKGCIVVSTKDSFKDEKRKRGPLIEVPVFDFPSTTELWKSYFE